VTRPTLSRGSVALTRFPFTDLTGASLPISYLEIPDNCRGSQDLQNVFNNNELDQDSVYAKFAHTAAAQATGTATKPKRRG